MFYYQQHIFLCINEKIDNRQCCAKSGSKNLLIYLKNKIQQINKGEKKICVSSSGCLGRCNLGPVLVIYPEGIWYHCSDRDAIDEIVAQHIIKKQFVTRLLLTNEK